MAPYVIDADNYLLQYANQIGGKAKNLFHLKSRGLPVPEFICISSQAYQACTQSVHAEVQELLRTCRFDIFDELSSTSKRIKSLILDCEILPEIAAQLHRGLGQLSDWTAFSVRSSAANEDGRKHSFAGQLGTWLNVPKDGIAEKIKSCWASSFEPGVLTYMHQLKQRSADNSVSVIVQRMVDAESAGVLFQADPKGGVHRQIIVAGYGLGEGVVSDRVETDSYVHNKLTGAWELEVNEKSRRLGYHPNGGTQEIKIAIEASSRPVLSEKQRDQLVKASAEIASIYDNYQDIEWSFDRTGVLYILQSRPITTIPGGSQRAFDNSNIVESYPGVVLPMTFSIFHLDYYLCIKNALRKFGVPGSVIAKREDVLRHLVGYVNGRAYYNISNWYRTLLAVPFLKERIIGYFEQMIGSDGAHEKDLNDIQATPLERWQLAAGFTFQFFSNLIQHDRLIRKYFVTTEQIKSEFEAIDLREQSSDQLIGYLSHFAARFMKSLSIPIVNDFFAMIFMALTKEQFKQSGVPDADKLLSKLLANQHIDSRKPVESLRALVRDLRQDSKLHAALNSLLIDPTNNETGRIGAALKANGYPEFAEKLNRHLSDYGHRSPKELIMEADTYRENPFHLLRILLESSTSGERESSNNADLEKQWAADLKTQRRGWLLKWLLNRTRKAIAYREATRLDRGLHFSFFRTLLREIGNRLVDEGVLSDSRDVFYLTLNELDEFRKGCSANGDLQGLVAYRKAQAQKWKSREQEGKLFTRGTVYANIIPGIAATWSDNVHALKGTGCSEGIVTATTRTVVDPNYQADVRGKILVSESTDPGWVFLMTISAGLVCERGSLLSHTAIIGRELGIPTIVGVKGATRYIADGSEITINGESGEIELSAKSLNG